MSKLIHQMSYIPRAALPINSYGYQFANTIHFQRHFKIQKHLDQLSYITNPIIVTQILKQSPIATDLNMQQIFVHPYQIDKYSTKNSRQSIICFLHYLAVYACRKRLLISIESNFLFSSLMYFLNQSKLLFCSLFLNANSSDVDIVI